MAPAVLLSDVPCPSDGYGGDRGSWPGSEPMETPGGRRCHGRLRLAHCLRQHREFVAVSPHGRAAFEAALADLQCLDRHGARSTWSYRVHVDGIDVTFWLRDVHGVGGVG